MYCNRSDRNDLLNLHQMLGRLKDIPGRYSSKFSKLNSFPDIYKGSKEAFRISVRQRRMKALPRRLTEELNKKMWEAAESQKNEEDRRIL